VPDFVNFSPVNLDYVRRLSRLLSGVIVAATLSVAPAITSHAVATTRVSPTVPAALATNMPLLRLHFSSSTKASALPALVIRPHVATKWQQIGPKDVQAVATSALVPAVNYRIEAPTGVRCARRCVFTSIKAHLASVPTNVSWEEQLLAQLGYLPLTFTPTSPTQFSAQQVPGTFSWNYPNLPTALMAQWQVGVDNVIVHGALMSFQSTHSLPTTGVADATTWAKLVADANAAKATKAPYDYVDVSMASPETLTLYVAGKATFHTLVNSGISVAPTATGTYPVYLRYTSQTMSGTNPDGSHYSDPGIPWVSYFNGGDALHGFLRSTYGWPQSLGCVEMPYAAAKTIWPFTSIGTLVTVHS